MKNLKFLFLFIGLAILASCSESDVEDKVPAYSNSATFSGAIGEFKTRVTDEAWEEGDAIGIFALIAESAPTKVYESKSNCQYVTSGNGKFTPVDASGIIKFPNEGDLDFVAYYPWQKTINDLEYTIVAGTDPLYSNNAKAKKNDNSYVDLEFNHMLSKLVLDIELGNNLTSLEGLSASVNNVIVDGKFNLASGAVTLGRAKDGIATNVDIASGNKLATLSTLVMPIQDLKNVVVVFSLGGNSYSWSPKATMKLVSNKEYTYKLKLNIEAEPYVVELGTSIINGWDEGHTEDDFEFLDPDKGGTPTPQEFFSDVTELRFSASSQLSKKVKLTTYKSQAWTITKTVDWLTLNPTVSGIGSKDITLTASKNTGTTERRATVVIIPTDNNDLSPIVITISQSGGITHEGGDGTKERPYSVAEAVANQGEKDNKIFVWVKAFIVGTESSDLSLEGAVDTNILIADDKEESDVSNAMPVELPKSIVRTQLNLKDNPNMHKAEVLLYGTLEYYFKGAGLKKVKGYELITAGEGH